MKTLILSVFGPANSHYFCLNNLNKIVLEAVQNYIQTFLTRTYICNMVQNTFNNDIRVVLNPSEEF